MLRTELARIRNDTEEAPWIVMGMTQWDAATDLFHALQTYSQRHEPPLLVAAMLPIRYHPNPPSPHVEQLAPDIMVAAVRDPRRRRSSFDVVREGVAPLFVLEVISPRSWKRDVEIKPERYERMGVLEYALFDPAEGVGEPALQGYRRDRDTEPFEEWEPDANGRLYSARLDLWLALQGHALRLQQPDGSWLPTYAESEAARLAAEDALHVSEAALHVSEAALHVSEAALHVSETAQQLAVAAWEREQAARQAAESELERLRAELEQRGGAT